MSGDVVTLFFDEKREKWRFLWGGETFYNDNRELMAWDTTEEAIAWYKEQGYTMRVIDEGSEADAEVSEEEREGQMDLLSFRPE